MASVARIQASFLLQARHCALAAVGAFASVVAALALAAGCGSDDTSAGGAGGAAGATTGTGATSTGGTAPGGEGPGGQGTGGSGGNVPGPCGQETTFATGLAPTSEIHVATTGSDQSGTGAAASPYATIDRAAQDLTPGAAIVVHAGTYAGGLYASGWAGTAAAPIWLGGASGEDPPVIEGGGTGLQLSQARYLVLHDLEVRGASDNGINIDDGGDYGNSDATRYLELRGLFVHDIGGDGNQDCLKLSGVNDYWVLDSSFARCGGGQSGSGIDHVGCHAGIIAGCSFDEMSGNAVQCKGGSENIEIRRSLLTDGGERGVNMGGSTGLEYFRPPLSASTPNAEARDIRVVANVIVGGFSSLAFVGCVDCLAANNTIVDPEHWILRILQETTTGSGYEFLPCSGGRFVNNVVYFARASVSTTVNIGPDTDGASFAFQSNLWYAHDNPGASAPTDLPVAETNAVVGSDPGFANATGGDYSIGLGSPAATAGTALPEVTADYDGNCYGSPPSIGAFQAR